MVQEELVVSVLSGHCCKHSVTAVKVFRLKSLLIREETTSFCPIFPCVYLLFFTAGPPHSQKIFNLLPVFTLFCILSPSFCIHQDVLPTCGLLWMCCSLPHNHFDDMLPKSTMHILAYNLVHLLKILVYFADYVITMLLNTYTLLLVTHFQYAYICILGQCFYWHRIFYMINVFYWDQILSWLMYFNVSGACVLLQKQIQS